MPGSCVREPHKVEWALQWSGHHEVVGQEIDRCAARAHEGFAAVGGGWISKRPPHYPGLARSGRADADARRVHLRRRAARAARTAAIDEPARELDQAAAERV